MSMSVLVMLVLVLCCLPVLIFSFWSGALSFPLPKRNFVPRDMMLAVEELGEGWQMIGEYEGMAPHWKGSLVTEAWYRDFVYKLEGQEIIKIEHFAYRFDNKPHARNVFRNEFKFYRSEYPAISELSALFHPRYADEWMLAQGASYYAVYDEYLVAFGIDTGKIPIRDALEKAHIPFTQIASWLRTLDERAGKLLGKTK